MLRRIDVKNPWRSLDKGFWPDDLPLGARTVLYGHNGSGKSTLSELLLLLSEGASATDVTWEDESQQRLMLPSGDANPPTLMAVYTRRWVEANLSAFLDGAGASAIVTLGKEAIDAREEEATLTDRIAELRSVAADALKHQRTADAKAEKLVRDVQDRVVSELRVFDYAHFTKSRYSVTKLQDDLRAYRGDFPNSNSHADALRGLGQDAPKTLREVATLPANAAEKLSGLSDLLAETPTRVAIQALEGSPIAQAWVEQGLELHDELEHCLFCAGKITAERREELARHFDQSWLQIRGRTKTLRQLVTDEREALLGWYDTLPPAENLASDLRPAYEAATEQAKIDVDDRVAAFDAVETALDAKGLDPSATPDAPDWSPLRKPQSTVVLTQAVTEHNEQVHRHDEATAERKRTVLDHLIGSHGEAFRVLEAQADSHAVEAKTAEDSAQMAERRLNQLRQERFTTKHMADTLTRDLARVYGKDHLSVVVTPDGKSYACLRGDEPGTDLSDGERTTLSLLYFLRKLEDEQAPGGDRSQRIVVIDDPSSSLDREALFATHQWLFDTLKGFGQVIILTHDFSLLRLFITSHKSAWGKSMSQIKKGDADEIRFPKVSFLELYASSVDGERHSHVGKLPRVLLSNTSEYAYLFSMVMAGVADSSDHERLFLLPNAARRVLEVFASYKAPHRTNFMEQLATLVESQDGEPYRDVYDFCNRFSHGEGSESIDVLDARAVHGQIRRSMEFLRAVDREHFERMCKASGIEPATLP
ncbi:AAA family ATPase [Plantibacter flavus]|uniref:AAA family ATPase n=1 Tax=Plantibacter flavus TaxID=150123 RepID=UPI003F13C3D7